MLKFQYFQLYWPNWWHILPVANVHPADEFGIEYVFICWSIFQTRWVIQRK